MNCIVTLGDPERFHTVEYLAGALRHFGKWDGDIYAIMQDGGVVGIRSLNKHGVKTYSVDKKINGYCGKYWIFSMSFQFYEWVLYLDPVFFVYKPVQEIFDKRKTHPFYWDMEPFDFRSWWNQPVGNVDMRGKGFNAGAILYNTSVLTPAIPERLFLMHRDLDGKDIHLGGDKDQPKINLFWNQYRKPENCFPDNIVCYFKNKDDRTVLGHTCSISEIRKCEKYFREARAGYGE
jgi:hypothetical protein